MSKPTDANRAPGFEEARQIVIDTVRALATGRKQEWVSIQQAHARILAEAIAADRDYPALRRSLRDGFAVKLKDIPGILNIRGEVRAGEARKSCLEDGEALEIMTGAPVPDEAEAVVMVEHVTRVTGEGGQPQVKIERAVEPQQFINARGSEVARSAILLRDGLSLDASHIATLAMTGHSAVAVYAKPSVAILSTGDEIVDIDEHPEPHQIRNSNSYMLAALVGATGGIPRILPVARDTPAALRPLLEQGLGCDMLLISGGVSAGRYDLVKPTLRDLDTEFLLEHVRIQPGGPTAFGTRAGKPVFGLPGNPGSTMIAFQLFVKAALELLAGESDPVLPLFSARFEEPFRHRRGLTRFLPARLSGDGRSLRHLPWQGSSDVPALSRANAFLVADHDRETWEKGDAIRVMAKL